MKTESDVCCVIVLFNPNVAHLLEMLNALRSQVDKIFLMDNSVSDNSSLFLNFSDVVYIYLGGNKGIAYAQNIGISKCFSVDCNFVITFDQDSVVPENIVKDLKGELQSAVKNGFEVACIGPCVVNERDGKIYQKYFNGSSEIMTGLFSVKSVISSGCLFPIESFLKVGLNKAHWFIDSIDVEWCYRANHIGYKVLMTKNVRMLHNLGEHDLSLGNTKMTIGAPSRLYFVYRNWIFSLRESSFSFKYKARLVVRLIVKFFIFSFVPPRSERVRHILRGVWDGLLNRSNRI